MSGRSVACSGERCITPGAATVPPRHRRPDAVHPTGEALVYLETHLLIVKEVPRRKEDGEVAVGHVGRGPGPEDPSSAPDEGHPGAAEGAGPPTEDDPPGVLLATCTVACDELAADRAEIPPVLVPGGELPDAEGANAFLLAKEGVAPLYVRLDPHVFGGGGGTGARGVGDRPANGHDPLVPGLRRRGPGGGEGGRGHAYVPRRLVEVLLGRAADAYPAVIHLSDFFRIVSDSNLN